jgi:predicted nucleic acid-binding Zn finger protein
MREPDLWQRLGQATSLDAPLRAEIEAAFGIRGKKAIAAIDEGKVRKYLDFYVVEGKTAHYIVEEDFCTCSDFMYRGRTCWHLLAVRIAAASGTYRSVDSWYQDQLKDTAPHPPGR